MDETGDELNGKPEEMDIESLLQQNRDAFSRIRSGLPGWFGMADSYAADNEAGGPAGAADDEEAA